MFKNQYWHENSRITMLPEQNKFGKINMSELSGALLSGFICSAKNLRNRHKKRREMRERDIKVDIWLT